MSAANNNPFNKNAEPEHQFTSLFTFEETPQPKPVQQEDLIIDEENDGEIGALQNTVPVTTIPATTTTINKLPARAAQTTPEQMNSAVFDDETSMSTEGQTTSNEEVIKAEPAGDPSEALTEPNERSVLYEKHKNLKFKELLKTAGIFPTTLWALGGAAISAGASLLALPEDFYAFIPAVTALGFFLGAFAWIDVKTHVIRNEQTLVAGAVTAALTIFGAIITGHPLMLLIALGSAIVGFGLFIVLILVTGFASGGDIKLSPVPTFTLGVISPLTGVLWLLSSFIIAMFLLIAEKISGKKSKLSAFGPAMVLAVPVSILATVGLYDAASLGLTFIL